VQQSFSKFSLFSGLAMALAILAIGAWLKSLPNRPDRPERIGAVHFQPVNFDPAGFAPLRLVGAWEVEVDDPRFGGVSAVAVDHGRLLALTDSGTLIQLPMPGGGQEAIVRDLPAGPANSGSKINRDSEALARDPAGRGWWVAFEQWHQLWLYDPGFSRALIRIDFGRHRWSDNKGIEAMIAADDGLLIFPERGEEWLRIRGDSMEAGRLVSPYGYLSDGVRIPDGTILLVTREMGPAGLAKRLVTVEPEGSSKTLRSLARLELGALDNVEAIASEPGTNGAIRLWCMTDNDFRRGQRTLLVALDYVPIARHDKSPATGAGLLQKPSVKTP